MLPGPNKTGSPHAGESTGTSVVNATTDVGNPSIAVNRIAGSVRICVISARLPIAARNSARFSWIEAITGPIATPRSTSTASDSCREDSSVSGTASVAPAYSIAATLVFVGGEATGTAVDSGGREIVAGHA